MPLFLAAAMLSALASASCRPHGHGQQPVGYSNAPEVPPPHDDKPMVTRDLGAVASDQCDTSALVGGVGAHCKRVIGKAATGSEPVTSANAFDGDACTVWNGGGPAPRFVAVDFGELKTTTGLLLVTEMTPEGAAKHVIDASDDGETWRTVYIVEGAMGTARAYSIPFQAPVTARYLRITTEKSTGWIAWRDIDALDCE